MPRRIVPAAKVFRPDNGLKRIDLSKQGVGYSPCAESVFAQREGRDVAAVDLGCKVVGNYEAGPEENG